LTAVTAIRIAVEMVTMALMVIVDNRGKRQPQTRVHAAQQRAFSGVAIVMDDRLSKLAAGLSGCRPPDPNDIDRIAE
jgi:hypothetical protein